MAKKKTASVVAKQMAVATASAKRRKAPPAVKVERPVLSAVKELMRALADEHSLLHRIEVQGSEITLIYLKTETFEL